MQCCTADIPKEEKTNIQARRNVVKSIRGQAYVVDIIYSPIEKGLMYLPELNGGQIFTIPICSNGPEKEKNLVSRPACTLADPFKVHTINKNLFRCTMSEVF